jgi:cytochrome b involved in lipid metabolism
MTQEVSLAVLLGLLGVITLFVLKSKKTTERPKPLKGEITVGLIVLALEPKDYTPQELSRFNGKDEPYILIAIRRKVFDVTSGRDYYGPGSFQMT